MTMYTLLLCCLPYEANQGNHLLALPVGNQQQPDTFLSDILWTDVIQQVDCDYSC